MPNRQSAVQGTGTTLTTPNLEGDTPELLSLITLTLTNQHIKEYKLLAVNMG